MMRFAARTLLIFLTAAAILFAGLNIAEEHWLHQSFYHFLILWALAPCINAVAGLRAKRAITLGAALILASTYAAFFSLYATNGPSNREAIGAEHMHIVLVPFIVSPAFALVVWYFWFCAKRIVDAAQRRKVAA